MERSIEQSMEQSMQHEIHTAVPKLDVTVLHDIDMTLPGPGPEEPSERIGSATSHRRAMNYSRKRAVGACQRCRARKTKCDNQRPSCGFCQSVGASCQYSDNTEHSSFDPASLLILSRLDKILETQQEVLNAIQDGRRNGEQQSAPSEMVLASPSSSSLAQHSVSSSLAAGKVDSESVATPDSNSPNALNISSPLTSPDMILAWPIFEGIYPVECLQDAVFSSAVFGTHPNSPNGKSPFSGTDWSQARQTASSVFQESRVVALVSRFLSLVHTKNPISDGNTLMQMAHEVAEEGLSWDGSSCIVLLACALATLATPFEETHIQASCDQQSYQPARSIENPDLHIAEGYYTLARRRIGCLKPSIMASQCYLLSGVYHMYALRPVEAFQEFHQASITFQTCLKLNRCSSRVSRDHHRLEQRMYSSCFKSECEILSEIPMPPSGITECDYPHMFPSPPDQNSALGTLEFAFGTTDQNMHKHEQEQSWFYYLAEISLRRIGNRILNAFYRKDHVSWMNMDTQAMRRTANQFMQELVQWQAGLPALLKYDQNDLRQIPKDELTYQIRSRVLEIRSWIFRPFLFYALHHPADSPDRAAFSGLVEQALLNSMYLIQDSAVRHRHHGTWYTCRVSISAALSILAAARTGSMQLPADWQISVQLTIDTLTYWEEEGPGDMRLARVMLQELLSNVIGCYN